MTKPSAFAILDVLTDLMLGGRHSRTTVTRMGVSFPTADRWLKELRRVPGIRSTRVGKTTWFEWRKPPCLVFGGLPV